MQTLQKRWYDILKRSGFNDIEHGQNLKCYQSLYFHSNYSAQTFECKEVYYHDAAIFLHDYPFPDHSHQEIWRLHSEGLTIRAISKHFKEQGFVANKDKIHKVIRHYAKVMKEWNA